MKKIINGKAYNTETAKELGSYWNGYPHGDFSYVCETLYVKRTGEYFLHSHVAYLINQGVAPLIIKERVGHTDIKTTLNIYGHLYPNEQRKVAEMLNMKK